MIVTLEWLLRLQEDLPRPLRAGAVYRVICPNHSPPFTIETPGVFRSAQTFTVVAHYVIGDDGCQMLRWVLPKEMRVAL